MKLPSDIISAYFSAIGSIFDSFKQADQSESAALTESLKLEYSKQKVSDCIDAVKAKDDDRYKELGCDSLK